MTTQTIFGYCPVQGDTKRPIMTGKAVRVTVREIDGEESRAATCWLPRSIAQDLTVTEVRDPEFGVSYEVRATVPAWWVRKLDTRAGWEVAGYAQPPMATRPY